MIHLYELTDAEKQDLVNRLSQDVTFLDEEQFDSERDVSNTELFDLEAYANDNEEAA